MRERNSWEEELGWVSGFPSLPSSILICWCLNCIRNNHACGRGYDWPEEDVEDLSDLRDYFPIIQRMQTWMHHVSRYDGWSENDHLKETDEAILARRKWIRKVAESLFEVLSGWDGGLNYK
jgi:hypothetical protein